jgi:hypothetical protein
MLGAIALPTQPYCLGDPLCQLLGLVLENICHKLFMNFNL